jgi:tetratricopeptide (TPR) repeat protein
MEKRIKSTVGHPLGYYIGAKTTLPNSNFISNDHKKIINFYTKKLLESKTNKEVSFFFHQRGCVYFDTFQYELCENDYMNSLKYYDKSASLHFDLCGLNSILNRNQESIEFGEKSIELDSSNVSVYAVLAGVYSKLGELEKSMEYCKLALELDPYCLIAYHILANTYLKQENHENALFYFTMAIDTSKKILKPNDNRFVAVAYRLRSWLHESFNLQMNDLEMSIYYQPCILIK